MVRLLEQFMRPNQELTSVKYFSARPDDVDKSYRQNAFFQANQEDSRFKLILGKYLRKTIKCFNCGNLIHTYEEKESDVRIATQIVNDANLHLCDVAIVVSADSDMIPAIELAQEAGVKVYIYIPPFQHSNALSTITPNPIVQLQKYESRFKKSMLPDEIKLKMSGYALKIPMKWKSYQSE